MRGVKEATSVKLLQSGLDENWWADSMEWYTYLRNIWNALTLSCLEKVARWAVFAAEVGGRWSDETAQFMHLLAKSNAANAPALMRSRSKAAWLRRWGSILACIAALAFTVSLLQQ